ncbi:MAG: hydrogenase formation protein HypD [Verrucomicrobiae bacterium]|nr:hydrogenase formation protein HypD [Verrucomicrobiae bacterium]
MKYVDDYRDREAVRHLADAIARAMTRPWTIMEVCGGQTHAIVRFGLDTLLPEGLTLVHGPGCPVCVTPAHLIDASIAIARHPGTILCSFGDMLRVPGSKDDLFRAKSEGADVRIVYSPMDALRLATANPDREIVFFAVGFETTAPANAMAVHQARARGVRNFSILCSHVLVPPAMEAVIEAPDNRVQGFLAAGHVCAIMGWEEYLPISRRHRVPIVVTGFEPVDILQGVLLCVRQLEEGRAEVENQYARWVSREGNAAAQQVIREVFRVIPRDWRGIGTIPGSGFGLSEAYADFDATRRFALDDGPESGLESGCISGSILQGRCKPKDCPHFGTRCRPEHPLGATMVSDEGACAAYFRYRQAELEILA